MAGKGNVMADVLIVCVREDEPKAKALAEMFEAAGFSIGGAPANDAALRSSGAGVVVWSQASIRSRPFLDAAQRVINANKAVVASLIAPPPASSIGSSPAFDLTRWSGDPNDPSLDPLFFAVDRMVNSARAGVGAADVAEAYEPPPPQPAIVREPPRPAPPLRPAPMPAPAADPLDAEAEHWRTIRDSRDPADFMDYISRYGPKGTFSEVAEIKLKQLTGERAPAPAPRPTQAATPRLEVARREPAPARRAETALPPARRTETPPPPRRSEPPPRRERDYSADLREPPRAGGGALRAFILILLLGGAALFGGLYFGGGIGRMAGTEDSAQPDTATVGAGEPFEAPSEPITGDASSGAVEPAQRLSDISARDEAPAPRQTETARREPPRETTRVAAAEPARTAPPPSNQSSAAGTGGPISLVSGASPTPAQTGATVSPPATQYPADDIYAASTRAPAAEPAPPRTVAPGSVAWAQRPSARRIAELYPQRAMRNGVGGRVQLDCQVQATLSVTCSIASETPVGEGFGRAALAAAGAYRAQPQLSNGASAVGSSARIAVNFQAPQD